MPTMNAKPNPLDIDLSQTAVVVVDMQNAFATKGGMFDLAGFDISGAANTIEVNQGLLETCRGSGVQVVYLQMTYKKSLETDISQYSMQDRQVIYEQRQNIRKEMQALERKVGLADPDINALGVNKVDFRKFGEQ